MDEMDTTLEMERFLFLIDPFCTCACSAKGFILWSTKFIEMKVVSLYDLEANTII